MPLTSTLRPAYRIAVTSGKGGVGKTTVTINTAVALAQLGYRVGIIDGDFALGNIDVLLGLSPHQHLGHVLAGECEVDDVVLGGPSGVRVLPAGSGVRALTAFDEAQWQRLAEVLDAFAEPLDFVLVDTASGIADAVINLVLLTDYTLVVSTFDPAALVDAYAIVKLLTAIEPTRDLGVLVNHARSDRDATLVYRQLATVSERFLGRRLRDEGAIAWDADVVACGHHQRPVVVGEREGEAYRAFRSLARRLAAGRPPVGTHASARSRARRPGGPVLVPSPVAEVERCA